VTHHYRPLSGTIGKRLVPVATLKPMRHYALPPAQDANWNYSGLPREHREITVFVLELVRDTMRKASAMGSLLQALRRPAQERGRYQKGIDCAAFHSEPWTVQKLLRFQLGHWPIFVSKIASAI
jgi:hypothetical protein